MYVVHVARSMKTKDPKKKDHTHWTDGRGSRVSMCERVRAVVCALSLLQCLCRGSRTCVCVCVGVCVHAWGRRWQSFYTDTALVISSSAIDLKLQTNFGFSCFRGIYTARASVVSDRTLEILVCHPPTHNTHNTPPRHALWQHSSVCRGGIQV